MSLGGILVIAGVLILVFWSFWLGLIVALIGLVAFGGFVRGKWYWTALPGLTISLWFPPAVQNATRLKAALAARQGGHKLEGMPEEKRPDIRPQLRESLAWYDEVLGRIEAGAIVAPGEQERLTAEASAVAHLLDLLDSSADEPAG
jgi:hypothetical protein